MEKIMIKQILIEQREIFEKPMGIVKRKFPQNILKNPKIVVITGIRRSGKSTLLKEFSCYYKDYSYVNFEDERFLDFTYQDFNALLESFLEINSKTKTFFFDEIQNIKGWEKFVRRLFTDKFKIFVTGSNANLLSSEIATSLTGRNLKIELYPFSFEEYLSYLVFPFKKIYNTKERAQISNHLADYFNYGGFPEVIKTKNYEELTGIYQDILIKDLLVRLKIRDSKDFRELALYLLSNISKKISYNQIKNLFKFSNTSKVKNYVDFLSEAYMFFTVTKYAVSLKKQLVNNRKIYAIDLGIINAVAFQFSKNKGRLMENLVFLELKRRNKDIFYFEEKSECDFLIKQGTQIIKAIQVTDNLSNFDTKKRKITGLLEAMNMFKLDEGLIITSDMEDELLIENKKIKIVPLWKWLLNL